LEHRTPREILQGRIRNDKKRGILVKKEQKLESDRNCSVNTPEESLTLGCNPRI